MREKSSRLYIEGLERQLAEARAQIAAQPETILEFVRAGMQLVEAHDRIKELEAQIAAKDAALKDAQDLYEQTRAELTAALRDAAEARGQIAEHIRLKNELVAKCYPAMDERDKLRAQIAAKDAALREIAEYTSPLHSAGEIASAALAQSAPAQEDKP